MVMIRFLSRRCQSGPRLRAFSRDLVVVARLADKTSEYCGRIRYRSLVCARRGGCGACGATPRPGLAAVDSTQRRRRWTGCHRSDPPARGRGCPGQARTRPPGLGPMRGCPERLPIQSTARLPGPARPTPRHRRPRWPYGRARAHDPYYAGRAGGVAARRITLRRPGAQGLALQARGLKPALGRVVGRLR